MRKEDKEGKEFSSNEEEEPFDRIEEEDENQGQEDNSSEEILRFENHLPGDNSYTVFKPSFDPNREKELLERLEATMSEREGLRQRLSQLEPADGQAEGDIKKIKEMLRTLEVPAWEIANLYRPIIVKKAQHLRWIANWKMLGVEDLALIGCVKVFEEACKFDPRSGKPFPAIAYNQSKWAMIRAIYKDKYQIDLTDHKIKEIRSINNTKRILAQELGREPTTAEIANQLKMPEIKVIDIAILPQLGIPLDEHTKDDGDEPSGEEDSDQPQNTKAFQTEADQQASKFQADEAQEELVVNPSADEAQGELVVNPSAKELASRFIHRLNPTAREVFQLIFGMGNNYPHTRKEVAEKLGISPQHVTVILNDALSRLGYLEEQEKRETINREVWSIEDFNSKLQEKKDILDLIPKFYSKEIEGSDDYIVGPQQINSPQGRELIESLSWFPDEVEGKLPPNYPIGRNQQILLEGQLEILKALAPNEKADNIICTIIKKWKEYGVNIEPLQKLIMTIIAGRSIFIFLDYLFKQEVDSRRKNKPDERFDISKERLKDFASLKAGDKDLTQLSEDDKAMLKKAVDEHYTFVKPRQGPQTHDYLFYYFIKICDFINYYTLKYTLGDEEKGREAGDNRGHFFWSDLFELFHQLLPTVVRRNARALRKHYDISRREQFKKWFQENQQKFSHDIQDLPFMPDFGIPLYNGGLAVVYEGTSNEVKEDPLKNGRFVVVFDKNGNEVIKEPLGS